MAEGSAGGQEQIPREVAVVRRRHTWSAVWEHFTRFTTADGQGKAKCKNCSAELVADTKKHGNTHLWRHVYGCRNLWEHFTRVTSADGEAKAKCKYCSAELAADTKRHGTGTLWSHFRRCRGQDGAGRETPIPRPPQPREAASESSNLKPGYKEACEDLARMIALRGYDSSVVEDDYFRSFVRRLDPAFEVPSRRTTEEMCDRIFDEAEEDLSSKLERALTSGRVNFALREAKTIEGTVLCAACHFIDDEWNLREMIKDADLVVHHRDMRGPLLGIREVEDYGMVVHRLADFAFDDNPFSLACGTLSHHLELKYLQKVGFCYLYPVKRQLIYTTYMDKVLHSIARVLLDIICNDDYSFCEIATLKLRLARQQREEHLLQLSLPDLWTYNERWYAIYCSLEVVQKVRSSTSKADVATFRIVGERESEFERLLRKLWGTIYRAIQTISATNRPTSNLCLIELFKVREALESKLEMDSIDEANVDHEGFIHPEGVPDVLSKARDTLDRSIEDSYLVWSIPLVLDPRYKLSYIESNFNNAFESGAAAYIKEVKTKIEEIFSDYNQADKQTSSGDSNCRPTMSVDSTYSLERYFLDQQEPEQQYDDSILRKLMEEMEIELKSSELDRYLEEVRVLETDDFNILKWWKDHSSTYPTVARMARDALAMPTCSKLSSELMSHIRSRVRGYSEEPFVDEL